MRGRPGRCVSCGCCSRHDCRSLYSPRGSRTRSGRPLYIAIVAVAVVAIIAVETAVVVHSCIDWCDHRDPHGRCSRQGGWSRRGRCGRCGHCSRRDLSHCAVRSRYTCYSCRGRWGDHNAVFADVWVNSYMAAVVVIVNAMAVVAIMAIVAVMAGLLSLGGRTKLGGSWNMKANPA